MGKAAASATRLAHVTDAHATVDGRPTTVLKHRSGPILEDILEQLGRRSPDCVLFGGDNIDNRGTGERDIEAFAALVAPLRTSGCDWRWVPGNHEASAPKPGRVTKAQFQRRFADHGVAPEAPGFSVAVGDVRVIGIDTTLIGAAGGFVAPDGLAFLAEQLRAAMEPHIVVLGHHLLAPCWSPYPFETWAKDYLVGNHEEVVGVLAREPRVRAYLCGHHHAHRITPVWAPTGRSRSADPAFHQIMTGSPVAYPHTARVLTFYEDGFEVETVRSRVDGVIEEGRQAVLQGRKALRFAEIGASDAFLTYLEGTVDDNDVRLPYVRERRVRRALPRAASR